MSDPPAARILKTGPLGPEPSGGGVEKLSSSRRLGVAGAKATVMGEGKGGLQFGEELPLDLWEGGEWDPASRGVGDSVPVEGAPKEKTLCSVSLVSLVTRWRETKTGMSTGICIQQQHQ